MKKKALALAIAALLLMPYVYAAGYYADLKVDIDAQDYVTIKGNTNHPSILTESTDKLISKTQGKRLLEIKTQEQFSQYIIELNFPSSTAINYVKSEGLFRIESSIGKLTLVTFAENKPIDIKIQYQIGKSNNYLYWLLLLPLGAIAAFYLLKRKKKLPEKKEEKQVSMKGLTYRQKQIAELLISKNKPLTQTEIEEELKIPKSSISRNIHTLELKGIIEKEKTGMSNKIALKQH